MPAITGQEIYISNSLKRAIDERISLLENANFSQRLWQADASLWGVDDATAEVAGNSLGWLKSVDEMERRADEFLTFKQELLTAGFSHVVLIGMGGSSMAPMVFQQSFAASGAGLRLKVLDTTDPATILDVERDMPIEHTLFVVASKSGTTAEPVALMEYFFSRAGGAKTDAGKNFVAITDPGSWLEMEAHARGFRRVFHGIPDIGGRYSALSPFGIVPAALTGVDLKSVLSRAREMATACRAPESENPGIVLGAILGELARQGRDKLTLSMPATIATFGLWLEQLLAESTGKQGTGILPVTGEPIGLTDVYGDDRVFVHIGFESDWDAELDLGLIALAEAGHPVIRITMKDLLDIGAEFMRWEVATATAGAVLTINPFDQPNVRESKGNTNRLLDLVKEEGRLPEPEPSVSEGTIGIYADAAPGDATATMAAFFASSNPGDYACLMAYLTENEETVLRILSMRLKLLGALRLATTSGYGPRFLHSTGQFHKGGPNTGIYLQLTADDAEDAPVPGSPFTFGVIKRAQALGDLEALRRHGRRVMRIHLGSDVNSGLEFLEELLSKALASPG